MRKSQVYMLIGFGILFVGLMISLILIGVKSYHEDLYTQSFSENGLYYYYTQEQLNTVAWWRTTPAVYFWFPGIFGFVSFFHFGLLSLLEVMKNGRSKNN